MSQRQDGTPGMERAAGAGQLPGDEAEPGTPGTGEALCPVCAGKGKVDGRDCDNCGGTGKITEGVGGA
jgi:DnaJ-class molecular chaperone